MKKEILFHFYFFSCSRIHCYFTFTFFFHFRFLSSPRQLLGSTGCFTISAQRRHNRPSVKRGCAVWSHIFLFFSLFILYSTFTFYDFAAAQPSVGQMGLCSVESQNFLQILEETKGQIIRVPQSWFLKPWSSFSYRQGRHDGGHKTI